MISLLSTLTVLRSFLWRYSSSLHTPRVLSNLQNRVYSLYRFSSFESQGAMQSRKVNTNSRYNYFCHEELDICETPCSHRSGLERYQLKNECSFYNILCFSMCILTYVATCTALLMCLLVCAVRLGLIILDLHPSQPDFPS